jgi:hypothetical protein
MAEYDQILEVKEDAEARLRTIPGVHAVGISKKVVGGKPTGELCITVFLVEKKPLDQLAPEAIVPALIDGVPTDVVEMEMPRLEAADPANLIATVSANQLSVVFSGHDRPGDGLGILLFYTAGPTGAPPGTPRNVYFGTADWMTLDDIASGVATAVNAMGSSRFTVAALGGQVTFIPLPGGNTCAITRCSVFAIDDRRYAEEYIRGGIQIELKDAASTAAGTLGCIATTAPTAADPQGKVVGITCQHVVAPPAAQATNLTASSVFGGNQIHFGILGTDPILLDTLIVVRLRTAGQLTYYTTINGDVPLGIAGSVATAITNLGIAGVSASATSTGPATAVVNLVGDTLSFCRIFGPATTDEDSDLTATVVGLAIDLRGEVSGDEYGIFTNVNAGGLQATFGVYTHPAKGATLSSIAQSIAQSINNLPATVRGSVTAAASAARVTVSNAREIECILKSDRQVGQPDSSFGSPCSHCCSHRIGHVLDARIDVDTALLQLDAGQKYKPEVEGIGLLTGTYDLQAADMNVLPLLKRGRTTGQTWGTFTAMDMGGQILMSTAFHRQYRNAALVLTSSPTFDPFSRPGDSGSAVFNLGGEVVGILFGGNGLTSLVTPIGQITAAFSALGLDVAPAPAAGQAPDDVRTVPAAAMAALTPTPGPIAAAFGGRLAQVEREIAATPTGSEVAAVVKRHLPEARHLVNSNRRAATVWQRNGGPKILEAALRVLQRRGQRLPEEIEGRPLTECLEGIERGLARYASPAFAADLSRFIPRLASFAGLTYAQVLTALRGGFGIVESLESLEPLEPLEPMEPMEP